MLMRNPTRGVGDVLNPTAGTALDCGLFAGGVFSKACWCLSFPQLCDTETYQAAYALAHPDVYAPVKAPPVVRAPGDSAPASATPDDILAQQTRDWQAQNRGTMNETYQNLQDVAASKPTLSDLVIPSWVWWAIGGVAAFVVLGGRR